MKVSFHVKAFVPVQLHLRPDQKVTFKLETAKFADY